VAFLAGGRLSDEDAYALSKLARTAFGTNDLDHRSQGGEYLPREAEQAQAAGMPVTYADVERARTIVVVGLDAEQELPILHLRLRKAVRQHGSKVVVVHPRGTRLWDMADHLLCRPGEEAAVLARLAGEAISAGEAEDAARAAIRDAGRDLVVLAGPRLAASPGAVAAAMGLASAGRGKFALLARRAGDRGALRAGVHPRLLPAGRTLEDDGARAQVEVAWGSLVPATPGRDVMSILEAASRREIEVLFLVGTDPLTDFPDASLARRALENVRYKVVIDISAEAMAPFADVMLPAAAYIEKDGHYTDWEGRAQRLRPVRAPHGMARSEWEIFQELSEVVGKDMGFHSLDALHQEMGGLYSAAPPRPEVGGDQGSSAGGEAGGTPAASGGPPTSAGATEGLTLFTYPLLVDEGKLSEGADRLKEALEEPAFVELHPEDADRLGIADGDVVRLRTEAGQAEVPARVTPHIARGGAFVPWNQPGLRANTLFSGRTTTSVTIEAARQEVSA
jgi:NADH-quinone oxidoreductase subunit G